MYYGRDTFITDACNFLAAGIHFPITFPAAAQKKYRLNGYEFELTFIFMQNCNRCKSD